MLFTNKIIRDLHMAITGPYLLNDSLNLPDEFIYIEENILFNWLEELDKDPEEIIIFTRKYNSYRLGRYFEGLMHYFFLFHPNIELLEFGRQIFKGRRTIGEMDFILRNKTSGENVHLETAVKYFAKVRGGDDLYSFICPNGSRNFGEKLSKTFYHQLKLSERAESVSYLKKEGYLPLKAYHYIKGTLFYHPDEINTYKNDLLSDDHQRGWWIYQKELDSLDGSSAFSLINKTRWLSAEKWSDGELFTKKSLIEYLEGHFENLAQGQMIVEFKELKGELCEVSRGFVMDDTWPLIKNISKGPANQKE